MFSCLKTNKNKRCQHKSSKKPCQHRPILSVCKLNCLLFLSVCFSKTIILSRKFSASLQGPACMLCTEAACEKEECCSEKWNEESFLSCIFSSPEREERRGICSRIQNGEKQRQVGEKVCPPPLLPAVFTACNRQVLCVKVPAPPRCCCCL